MKKETWLTTTMNSKDARGLLIHIQHRTSSATSSLIQEEYGLKVGAHIGSLDATACGVK